MWSRRALRLGPRAPGGGGIGADRAADNVREPGRDADQWRPVRLHHRNPSKARRRGLQSGGRKAGVLRQDFNHAPSEETHIGLSYPRLMLVRPATRKAAQNAGWLVAGWVSTSICALRIARDTFQSGSRWW